MTGKEEKVKKDRDPIMKVCFVVFILAVCAVIGAGIFDNYLAKDDSVVNNGDTVTVNYVGTFYNLYGGENAVVFDTTYSSIGNDSSIEKSNDYSRTSYSTLELTIGGDDVLTAFQNALVGHKVGDTVTVVIVVGDGYVAPDTTGTVDCSNSITVARSETMTVSQFESIYDDLDGTAINASFTSVYGWEANSTYNQSTGMVTVYYSPVAGESYDNYDGEYGKVTLNVSSTSDSSITFTYEVTDYVKVGTDSEGNIEIQMIKVNFGTTYFYITSVTDADSEGVADTFDYKTVGEKYNEVLYFEITIVSIDS
jgi:hypothetical protein